MDTGEVLDTYSQFTIIGSMGTGFLIKDEFENDDTSFVLPTGWTYESGDQALHFIFFWLRYHSDKKVSKAHRLWFEAYFDHDHNEKFVGNLFDLITLEDQFSRRLRCDQFEDNSIDQIRDSKLRVLRNTYRNVYEMPFSSDNIGSSNGVSGVHLNFVYTARFQDHAITIHVSEDIELQREFLNVFGEQQTLASLYSRIKSLQQDLKLIENHCENLPGGIEYLKTTLRFNQQDYQI